ncbi:MAG: Fe-S protein assembly co-chaperone HscB [Magnetococcus sp. WYHC-3]
MNSQPRACWSCKGPVLDDLGCGTCGAVQPPDPRRDCFSLFGLPVGFAVDLATAEARYRDLQTQFHPDRFATRSATERRYSLEQVTRLNKCWQVLRDPLERATFLLERAGRPLGTLAGSSPQDPEFLLEVMALREALEGVDPRAPDAMEQIDALRKPMQRRIIDEVAVMGEAFHRHDRSGDVAALDLVAAGVNRMRYHRRYLEELDMLEEHALNA